MPLSPSSKGVNVSTVNMHNKKANKASGAVPLEINTIFSLKMQLYWQLGDWIALEALAGENIDTLDTRAQCMLYIAAACFQLGMLEKGKTYLSLALQWGAKREEVHRVLISSVYNTLAVASVVADPAMPSIAERAFNLSATIALPGVAVPAVVKARTRNQLEHFRLENEATAAKVMLLQGTKGVAQKEDILPSTVQLLSEHYLFDEILRIWHRLQQHEFVYTDGDAVEQSILAAVRACADVSVFSQELFAHQTDWPSEYHLSADRVNLLRPFTEKLSHSNVLELGCGCGAITRFLGETALQVVSVEGSRQRAAIAAERCRDLDSVIVVLDKLQDLPFRGQFDVVTLIGVLEYSQIYVDAEDPIQHVLKRALSYLKHDGVLIVAIENQLGLKYFAGASEDHGVGVMAGINDVYSEKTAITFGKKEMEAHLAKAGFFNVETYLPFPDYKLPCLVVHPQGYVANDKFDLGALLSTLVFNDRQGVASPLFSLESAWPLVARNGLTSDLANSHLFVAFKQDCTSLTSPAVLASYYSPKRIATTSQEVTFFSDCDENIFVRRRCLVETGDSESQTIEKYQRGALHNQLLHKVLQRKDWTLTEVEAWLQPWFDALLFSAVECGQRPEGWPSYDLYLPANYIDAIPRNLIVTEQGCSEFIDLEWSAPYQIPLKLVLYRGLVVTLSTVTSIAEPADPSFIQRHVLLSALMDYCGYRLTQQDYQFFVPFIYELSLRAHGFGPAQNLRQDAIELQPFKVRYTGLNFADDRNIGLSLYWCTSDDYFCESRSYKTIYRADCESQNVKLNIASKVEHYTKLRLDIGDRPGCYIVDAIEIFDINSDLLWQWSGDVEQLKNIEQLTFNHASRRNHRVCLLSDGCDPQFEFKLPEHILIALSGGGFLNINLQSFV